MELLAKIDGILAAYGKQGYDLSLRQLYYQLVTRNLVENTEKSYKRVGNIVSDARLAGMIDWDMIKDRGREMTKNPHWESPSKFLEVVAPQFMMSLWKGQKNYVEVMIEKQALEGVLEPVCRYWDVPFTANKGYTSSSAMYEASKRFINACQQGKQLHIIYLGDHDPSGIDMTRDIRERLDLFLKVSLERANEIGPNELDIAEVHRVALNMDQVKKYKPPENPAKLTDSRASDYVANYGHSSWELDAIEPAQLAKIVRDQITELLDIPLFEKRRKEVEIGRKQLEKLAKKYL